LEAFQKEIADKNRGIVRACADDIGAALADIKYLSVLYPIFCQARVLAGLTLKPIKCVLVPLSAPLTRASKYDIQKWLERKIPEWVNFNLKGAGKYLGFLIGPEAGASQWEAPICKFMLRAQEINAGHFPINVSAHLYNSRAVSVLGYKAQLVPPPASFAPKERAALHLVTHFATNSLTHGGFFHLHLVGSPRITCASVTCSAALLRTAVRTHHLWSEWLRQLRIAAFESLPFSVGLGPLSSPLSGTIYPLS